MSKERKPSEKAALIFVDMNRNIRVLWSAGSEEWFDPLPLKVMAARLKKKGIVGLSRREVSSVKKEWFQMSQKDPARKGTSK